MCVQILKGLVVFLFVIAQLLTIQKEKKENHFVQLKILLKSFGYFFLFSTTFKAQRPEYPHITQPLAEISKVSEDQYTQLSSELIFMFAALGGVEEKQEKHVESLSVSLCCSRERLPFAFSD